MIRAEAVYKGSKFYSLVINGHGGLEEGKDIYCAGVSSCLIGALNALEHADNYSLRIESGHAKISLLQTSTSHDEVVLETLITQLQTMAKSYPERVKLTISKKEGQS